MYKYILVLLAIGGLYSVAEAWPRLGAAANIVTQNAGDKASGISVSLSSTTATKVYTGVAKHREVLIENTSTSYDVHCATYSALLSTTGYPRWILWKSPAGNFTTNGTYDIYCIIAAGGSGVEVVGSYEFDSKD